MIIKTISWVSPTGADDFIDRTLKPAGVESWLNPAKQACSKVPLGRLLENVFHQFHICCYALVDIHHQSTNMITISLRLSVMWPMGYDVDYFTPPPPGVLVPPIWCRGTAPLNAAESSARLTSLLSTLSI